MEQDVDLVCEVCGSNNVYTKTRDNKYSKILCAKHYQQIARYGKIRERTIRNKNKIEIKDNYCEIILYNKESVEVARGKIDIEDIEKIEGIKWRLSSQGRISCGKTSKHKAVFIHRLIMNCPENLEINHINFDPLDNRKSNLEIVDREGQMRRLKIHKKEYVCVYFEQNRQLWTTYIRYNKKKKHLGRFKTKEEAILKRKEAERIYWNF